MSTDEDRVLLRAWQQGDKQAGDRLLQRHFPSILRFFANKVGAGEEQDLIQATFEGCVKGLASFRGDASVRTYLFQIAKNVLADYCRKKNRRPEPLDLDEISIAALQPGPSSIVGRNRQQTLLLQSLRGIPIRDQMVLELYYWEQMPASKIGEVLSLVEGTVRSRIYRAIEALKKAMARLARTPQELESTVSSLDRWASEVRAQMDRTRVPPAE